MKSAPSLLVPTFERQTEKTKLLPFPLFASALQKSSPIEKDIAVGLTNEVFSDLFGSPGKGHANIILVPKSEKSLEGLAKLVAQASDQVGAISQVLTAAVAKPDAKKPQSIAYFDAEPPKKAPRGKKAAAKQAEETSIKNTTAMINAFKIQLAGLDKGIKHVTAVLPETLPEGVDRHQVIRQMATLATTEGYNYNFDRTKGGLTKLASVVLNQAPSNNEVYKNDLREGQVLGHAMNLTRHLVDSGANRCTSAYFARQAMALKSATLDVRVLQDDDLEGKTAKNDKRMGLFLSVAQGNDRNDPDRKPRLVEMMHTPKGWNPDRGKTVLLVGKGVIFDTGGSDLKPSEYAHNMRGDMGGAAAVLGTMKALDKLPTGVRVIALTPLTENRISGHSSLPQDVYTARSGNKVYIENTDAEGRLILADAMNYGLEKYNGQLDAVFTIATLTGGKAMSIGMHNAVGISGNNKPFLESLNKVVHGQLQRTTKGVYLLDQRHYKMVTNSSPADVTNVSRGPAKEFAGLIKPEDVINKKETLSSKRYNKQGQDAAMLASFTDGAAFLQAVAMDPNAEATKGLIQHDVPWGHFDIAGAEFGPRDEKRRNHEWASGIGVEDLYYSIKGISEGSIEPSTAKTKLPRFEA